MTLGNDNTKSLRADDSKAHDEKARGGALPSVSTKH
jgi:hypothetical protein